MPLDPQTTAWLDQEDAHLARLVRQHRWAVQYVGPGDEDDEPSFGYTISLFGLGHPELVLVGLGADTTHGVLQRAAEEVAAGRDLVPGEVITWDDRAGRLYVEASPNPGAVVLGGQPLLPAAAGVFDAGVPAGLEFRRRALPVGGGLPVWAGVPAASGHVAGLNGGHPSGGRTLPPPLGEGPRRGPREAWGRVASVSPGRDRGAAWPRGRWP